MGQFVSKDGDFYAHSPPYVKESFQNILSEYICISFLGYGKTQQFRLKNKFKGVCIMDNSTGSSLALIDFIPNPEERIASPLPERAGRVRRFLRDHKTDLAWGAGNAAFGAAVKLLTASTIAAGGASGLLVAVGGGVAAGVARQLVSHIRERRQAEYEPAQTRREAVAREIGLVFSKDFGKKALEKALFGTMMSAGGYALAGFGEAFINNTETGAKVAEVAKSGVGKLSALFNDKVAAVKGFFAPSVPKTITYEVPHNAVVISADPVAETPAPVVDKPKTGLRHKLAHALKQAVVPPAEAPAVIEPTVPVPTEPIAPTPAAEIAPAPQGEPVPEIVPAEQTAPQPLAPEPVAVAGATFHVAVDLPDGTQTTLEVPPVPNLRDELKIAQDALDHEYVDTTLRAKLTELNGVEPSADMTVRDMAAQIIPEDPDSYVETLKQTAVKNGMQLDPSKMASACVADFPKSVDQLVAQGGRFPATCHTPIERGNMTDGDFVVVRDKDVTQPTAKRGLRVLFAKLFGGETMNPNEFIDMRVSRETLPEMSAEAIAAHAPTQVAPQ